MFSCVRIECFIISIKFTESNVPFKAKVFFVWMDDLSIVVSGVLKSNTILGLLSVSPFLSVNICFMHLGVPMLGAYTFTAVKPSHWIDPFTLCIDLCFLLQCLFLVTVCVLKSILSDITIATLLFSLFSFT